MRFVPVDALKVGMVLGKDIINRKQSHMLKKGVVLSRVYIDFLQSKGYLGAYVEDEMSKDVSPQEAVSSQCVIDSINALDSGNMDAIISSAQNIVADVNRMYRLSIDLFDLRAFDDYTFHHSVNVAVYAVAVGKQLGMFEKDLILLSQAGLLHDLGKKQIPDEILNKKDRLTDDEYNLIKSHPQFAYDMLYSSPEISAVVRQAVLFHHENENGSGYPKGKEGSSIPLFAKIIHVVDVYDALTSRRPYKAPYAPIDAFEYLNGGKDILFDGKIVEALEKVVPAYPPGIEVGLSTGEAALVISQTMDPKRPLVKLLYDNSLVDLSDPYHRDTYIVASGIMPIDYVGKIEKLNESRQAVKELRKRIVLVDDSSMSLDQTSAALKCDEYNIIALQSGTAAMNYIKAKGEPDLLIMDIDMPVLNGIQTVANLRKMGLCHYPVIFLSALANKENLMKCKEVGAADFIIKPAKPTYLNERVAFALDRTLDR